MSFNKSHPERCSDEVFVTNADDESWPKISWLTKRKGNVSYGADGKSLGDRWRGSFPVFAKKDEIRTKNPEALQRLEV